MSTWKFSINCCLNARLKDTRQSGGGGQQRGQEISWRLWPPIESPLTSFLYLEFHHMIKFYMSLRSTDVMVPVAYLFN